MTFTKEILLRSRITLLAVVLFMLAIIWKIIYLQFLEGDKWRSHAKIAQLEYKPILASRGNIYADDGALLATSLPFYTVALDPTIVSDEYFEQEIDLLSQKLSDFYKDNSPGYYKMRITHARKKKTKISILEYTVYHL